MNARNLKLVCLLLETIGIAALFLPFTDGISPGGVLAALAQGDEGARYIWFVALPFFLAPFVCLQTLRSFFPRPLNQSELWLSAGWIGVLSLLPLGWIGVRLITITEWVGILHFWLFYVLAAMAAGLLLMLKRKGVSAEFLAPIALRGSYVPNAVFCLLEFSDGGCLWHKLEVGAACVCATVVLYLVEIAYLTIKGLQSRPAAGPC